MRKHSYKPPAPGLRQDTMPNRALARAFLRRKPWAIEAVQSAARNRLLAIAAIDAAFAGCFRVIPETVEEVA